MPDPIDANRKALLAKLAYHGFDTAAKFLSERDHINYSKALKTWDDYPACMKIYATHLGQSGSVDQS